MYKPTRINITLIAIAILCPLIFYPSLALFFIPEGCSFRWMRTFSHFMAPFCSSGIGITGIVATLILLVTNRKKLRIPGWFGILLLLLVNIYHFFPIYRYLVIEDHFSNKPHLLVYQGQIVGEKTIYHRMTEKDWNEIAIVQEPFCICFYLSEIKDGDITQLAENRYIQEIEIRDCPDITDKIVCSLAAIPRLKSVSLCGILKLNEPDFSDFTNLKRLSRLELTNCEHFSEGSLGSVPHLPRLKFITLRDCPSVTPETIKRFNDKNPQCQIIQRSVLSPGRQPENPDSSPNGLDNTNNDERHD